MECVLSIVDEGTRLSVLVATVGGSVVGQAHAAGPSNTRFISEPGLRRKLERMVTAALQGLPDAVCLSVAGALHADPEFLRDTLPELVPIDHERLLLIPFERCALAGSVGGSDVARAIVIHADVGSRGWGISDAGVEVSCGGFGEELGDEGSAYWIGRRGARAALKAFEKRSRNTLLKDRLLSHFRVDSYLRLLRPEFEPPAVDRYSLAGFAREVFEAARQEDQLAVEILEEAGRELAIMVLALVNQLELVDTSFQVLPCGSVFRGRGPSLESFIKVLKTKTTKANLLREGMGAVAGGALLAIHHLGLKIRSEMVDVLRSSLLAHSTETPGSA